MIEKIIIAAIPLSDCPVKRMHEEHRREKLKQNIQILLDEQKRAILADVQQFLSKPCESCIAKNEQSY